MPEITVFKDSYNSGQLEFRLVSVTIANPSVFFRRDHGLQVNDRVQFETDTTFPTTLTDNTWYFVTSTSLTSDEFTVATTKAGSAIQLTVAGTGQLYFADDKPRRLAVSSNWGDSSR